MTIISLVGSKFVRRLSTLKGVLFFLFCYGLLHSAITLVTGPSLSHDDVKINIFTQTFQFGYLPGNPPLFEWILSLVQQITGPNLLSFVIVKYVLLTATGGFCFLAIRAIGGTSESAALVPLALLATYQIGWNYHQTFTHTLVLIATTALFWFALSAVIVRRDVPSFFLLGIAVGLGLMAKYVFVAAVGSALAAALSVRSAREALQLPGLALSLVIAALIAGPHFGWVASDNSSLFGTTSERLMGDGESHFLRVLEGVPEALWALISFFLPLVAFIYVVGRRRAFSIAGERQIEIVFRRAVLFSAVALIAVVLVFGISNIQERYVIALMLPGILWLVSRVDFMEPQALGRLALLLSCAIGAFTGLRIIEASVAGAPFCHECKQWINYGPLKDAIEEAGYESGTLVGFEDHTAGNLRRLFPEARVLSAHMPFYTPLAVKKPQSCVFIWSDQLGPLVPAHVTGAIDPETAIRVTATGVHPFKSKGWMQITWTVALMDHSPERKRELCRIGGEELVVKNGR